MIPVAMPNLEGNEKKYVNECIDTNWISSKGKFVKLFEEEFAKYCECDYATSCSNGTSALHLALMSLGIKKGDEVIIPNLTFATTANVVKYVGAKEVLCDVDKSTFNIDPEKIEALINEKTRAIIVVHLYGFPCEMDKINEIAKKHNLFLIEDAAEAHGALYGGKKAGALSDVACFSFFGNKIITTGEGGMITTNNPEIIEKVNILKNHGMVPGKGYYHEEVGYNYRLTNLQSAIGLAQLERIDYFIAKRKEIFSKYKSLLPNMIFQQDYEKGESSFWMVGIITNKREEIEKRLKENNIETRRGFYPLNQMPPYLDNRQFPNSEELYEKTLILPTFIDITKEQIEKICKIIKNEEH